MKLLIKGGRVVDPANKIDEVFDLLIDKGKIISVRKNISAPGCQVIDAKSKIVAPGFIDMHVHLREPGREDEETISSGTKAAAAGGFCSIVSMANTSPVADKQEVVKFILRKAREEGVISVYPVGAVTKGLKGQELAEIGELTQAGIVAVSDDGEPIKNSFIMRCGLEYSKKFNLPLISHSEDKELSRGGVMDEGLMSTILGLPGIPAQAEEIMAARDIKLAELTHGKLHLAHVSTKGCVELVRAAKKKGLRITAEASPHHFSLTSEAVKEYDPNTRVNPPLRSFEDVEAIIKGLADGTIDAIASDHAPHSLEEREVEYSIAPPGIDGLETEVGLALNVLYHGKKIKLAEIIKKFTTGPAGILGLQEGTLSPGAKANVTILDIGKEWVVDKNKFLSLSRNTPFHGMKLKGKAIMTIYRGKIVYAESTK